MGKSDRCGDCKFWLQDHSGSITGECHAMPPAMVGQLHEPAPGVHPWEAIWPGTRDSQWCGKFEESDDSVMRKAERIRQMHVEEAAKRFNGEK